jgi:hypothetical protein
MTAESHEISSVSPSEIASALGTDTSALIGFYPDLVRRGIFRGLNLAAVADRLWRLEAMRADAPLPAITWRASVRRRHVSGRAWSRRLVLTIGESDIDRVVEVLLHELVHCSCPAKEHHGELFQRRLIACAREAFGLDLNTGALLALPVGNASKRAYAIDEEIRKAMVAAKVGERLRETPDFVFIAPRAETPPEIEARREAERLRRQEARRAHCEAMLATWERRATRAKKLVSKWKKRVHYYEKREARAAAKIARPVGGSDDGR